MMKLTIDLESDSGEHLHSSQPVEDSIEDSLKGLAGAISTIAPGLNEGGPMDGPFVMMLLRDLLPLVITSRLNNSGVPIRDEALYALRLLVRAYETWDGEFSFVEHAEFSVDSNGKKWPQETFTVQFTTPPPCEFDQTLMKFVENEAPDLL